MTSFFCYIQSFLLYPVDSPRAQRLAPNRHGKGGALSPPAVEERMELHRHAPFSSWRGSFCETDSKGDAYLRKVFQPLNRFDCYFWFKIAALFWAISVVLKLLFSVRPRNIFCNVKFEVLTAVTIMLLFWVLTSSRLTGRYKRLREKYYLHLQGWRRSPYVSPKCWYLCTSLHDVKTHNIVIFVIFSHSVGCKIVSWYKKIRTVNVTSI
jgi:hypothetical protein